MSASRGVNFVKIARQLPATRQYLTPTKIRGIHPGGFPYESFSGHATVKPWSVLRLIESQRALAFNLINDNNLPFLDAHKLYQDYFIFIVATKTEITPHLYDFALKKGPLTVDLELVNIGSKSFNLKTTVTPPDSDIPLCINYNQSLIVSQKSRKPADGPPGWQEKFSKDILTPCGPLRLPRLDVVPPPLASDYTICIPASDVDAYFHLNWTNTVKYCCDAVMFHLLKEQGGHPEQVDVGNVRCLSVSYLKECAVGDMLNVKLWRSSENENLFHFQLVKGPAEVITNECSIEYYPQT